MTSTKFSGAPLPDGLFERRRAGVLLHPASLPGDGQQGTFGADARRFVDLLADAGFSVWQVLPLGPVDSSRSPYLLKSAHAGDPRFIDLHELRGKGLCGGEAMPDDMRGTGWFDWLADLRARYMAHAGSEMRHDFTLWREQNRYWLDAYILFDYLRSLNDYQPWWFWPQSQREFGDGQLAAIARGATERLEALSLLQFYFDWQWRALRRYAHARGVLIMGDLPFYVDRDSVEVWSQGHLFDLDEGGEPAYLAGVPPDYFSADGQLWGNPVYNWAKHEEDGFSWWLNRIGTQARRFDGLRLDHFRALESFWAVPKDAESAREGSWFASPGDALLQAIRTRYPDLALIAEDLGTITDSVRDLRDRFGLPGMLILQFAFDGTHDNPYLPANHVANAVVYTGTHDNDTLLGWYRTLEEPTRNYVDEVIGAGPMPGAVIDAAYRSPAVTAIVPMQDLLGLDSTARMNTPGIPDGNWAWRFSWNQIPSDRFESFRHLAAEYERL